VGLKEGFLGKIKENQRDRTILRFFAKSKALVQSWGKREGAARQLQRGKEKVGRPFHSAIETSAKGRGEEKPVIAIIGGIQV